MTKTQINKALAGLEKLREDAEAVAADFHEATSELAIDLQQYVDEKSERWQEGDTGSAYLDLISELENIEVDVPEVPELSL
jgi:hypothetical protein